MRLPSKILTKIRGHLLNHMTNPLFNLFITFKFAKIIWKRLEAKHRVDDARKRKYTVGEWLQFLITNDKPIMEQVYIYGNLCDEVLNENMKNCEIRQANVLIVKFPSS